MGRIQGKVPGWREELAPHVNLRGEPMPRQEFAGPNFLSPFPTKKAGNDPVLAELKRLKYAPRHLKKVGKQKLEPHLASTYQMLARTDAWPKLQELIYSPEYLEAADEDQIDMIKAVLKASNKDAREMLFDEDSGNLTGEAWAKQLLGE